MKEINILISRYGSILQKINESIENNKFENIKKDVLKSIKGKDV